MAEINPSGLVMRLQAVCLSLCVASMCLRCVVADKTPLSRHANNTSTAENGVVCTLLTIHSRPRGLIMHHAYGLIKRGQNKDGRNEG